MTKTQSVGHLLKSANTGLARIIKRSKELQKLSAALKNMVDEPLCKHIYVANIRDTTLIIGTDSAIWHTRIKYLGPMILEQMQQLPGLENLQRIEFRIQPLVPQLTSGVNKKDLRVNAATAPQNIAESTGHNLQQAMQNIGNKREKNNG